MTNQAEQMTIEQYAKKSGKSAVTIRRAIKAGKVSARLVNGKYLITPGDQATIQGDLFEQATPVDLATVDQVETKQNDITVELLNRLASSQDQLTILAGRNGYLQRINDDQAKQIKLLTSGAERVDQVIDRKTRSTIRLYQVSAATATAALALSVLARLL